MFGYSPFGRPIFKSEIPISCSWMECIQQLFNVKELFYIQFENRKRGKQPKVPVQDSQIQKQQLCCLHKALRVKYV